MRASRAPSPLSSLFFCRFRDFLSRSCSVPESTALLWMGVFHQTIDLASFVIFREIFGNRQTLRVYKQQSMTILVGLHFVTGADPTPEFGLSLLVRIKITGTERLAHFLNMPRQSFDDDVRHGAVRM